MPFEKSRESASLRHNLELKPFSCPRVRKGKAAGTESQRMILSFFFHCRLILAVSAQWHSCVRHLHPNLMMTSRFQPNLNQRVFLFRTSESFQYPIRQLCLLCSGRIFCRHFRAVCPSVFFRRSAPDGDRGPGLRRPGGSDRPAGDPGVAGSQCAGRGRALCAAAQDGEYR